MMWKWRSWSTQEMWRKKTPWNYKAFGATRNILGRNQLCLWL